MLKPCIAKAEQPNTAQPPSGGCVLKPYCIPLPKAMGQPPSGGCVLKRYSQIALRLTGYPAAFRRLCVETSQGTPLKEITKPAAFRRLCVETKITLITPCTLTFQPPSGGCVLKPAGRRHCV